MMEDYDDMYQFKISAKDPKTNKECTLEKKISVTEIYDVKGYQHRYKVKEFLD